jgi:hypothetical protein
MYAMASSQSAASPPTKEEDEEDEGGDEDEVIARELRVWICARNARGCDERESFARIIKQGNRGEKKDICLPPKILETLPLAPGTIMYAPGKGFFDPGKGKLEIKTHEKHTVNLLYILFSLTFKYLRFTLVLESESLFANFKIVRFVCSRRFVFMPVD